MKAILCVSDTIFFVACFPVFHVLYRRFRIAFAHKKTARSLPERAVWRGLAVCRAVVAVFSEQVIVRADVLVMAVFHAEAAGDDAELHEAEAFVEMPRVGVGGDDGVELQDAKAQPLALHE